MMSVICTELGRLYCINVGYFQFFEHGYPGSSELAPVDMIITEFKLEVVGELWDYVWIEPASMWLVAIIASICKYLFLLGMPMQVNQQFYPSSFVDLYDLILDIVDFWKQFLVWLYPSSVQVPSTQRAPVIAMNHPVWIHHWENLKQKVIPKELGIGIIRQQKFYDMMNNPARDCLSWMRPGHQHNSVQVTIADLLKIGDCDKF